MAEATSAFVSGLGSLIDSDWLGLFSAAELQLLISGTDEDIDVDDMRRHTVYGGGYSATDPSIEYFWEAVESMTREQKWKLLKFVTSCSRPPLLGFKELHPNLTIYKVGDSERLPSAATCMNFLKLPAYPSRAQMKERLCYAVESDTGFELS